MAEPSNVALRSSLWFEECSKEELLARWQAIVQKEEIRILEQTEVKQIAKSDDRFTLHTNKGQFVAKCVIVCIGKRGAPRRLGLPGESYPRVRYLLDDPDDYAQQKVLVVGGGDSALEAALALADVTGAEVTLSYRQGAFTRAKVQNRSRLEAYQAARRIRVELKSTVVALESHSVRLATEQGELDIPNDTVFALLGADPPTEFLAGCGHSGVATGLAGDGSARGYTRQPATCRRV